MQAKSNTLGILVSSTAIVCASMMGRTASVAQLASKGGDESEPARPSTAELDSLELSGLLSNGPIPVSRAAQLLIDSDHEIAVAARAGRLSVLVHLDPRQDGPDRIRSPLRKRLRDLVALQGANVKHEYDVLPEVINLRNIPAAAVDAIRNIPGVLKVEEDTYDVFVNMHQSTPHIRAQAGPVGQITNGGAGVRICIVDTGIDSDHIMFAGRIDTAAGHDFANDDSNPEDDNGHGTHVAGIAAGSAFSVDPGVGCGTLALQGVATGATLIAVKVLGSNGSGFTSDVVAGINHCASAGLPGGRADIINLSLGSGNFSAICDGDSKAVAVNNAVNAGTVVVVAAGNNAFANAVSSPACASKAIAVAATYDANYPTCEDGLPGFSTCTDPNPVTDQRVCFSNRSSMVDVAAPGAVIWSASRAAGGNSITPKSGTSMAAPHVAGLAALVLDLNPSLTPADVKLAIENGAVDLGTAGFDTSFGHGRIDVMNTLEIVMNRCTSDAECNDGLFCNGTERCILNACNSGTAPCSRRCDEGSDRCLLQYWLVVPNNTNLPGLSGVQDEDIVLFDEATGRFTLMFDGSDVGLADFAIDAIAQVSAREILMSFTTGIPTSLVSGAPADGVDAADIVRFTATQLGANTAGTFRMYFDGSDVGMRPGRMNVDGLDLTSNGHLLLSVAGASGEDIVRFNPTSLGSTTAGTFSVHFDGSDVGLTTAGTIGLGENEDVDAIALRGTRLVLSTVGNFSVGVFPFIQSGGPGDLVEFAATSLGSTTAGTFSGFFDLGAIDIRGFEIVD